MNFVWLLGSGSNFEDEEIRYSIRSVLKYHPDSSITVVGECPHFYTGSHYYVPDDTGNIYLNTWNKCLKACELFDEWICMNDDFYLQAEFVKAHYYCGNIKDHAKNLGMGHFGKLIKQTAKVFPYAKRWTTHTPIPIFSAEFKHLTELYRDDDNVVSWKTMYCEINDTYPKIEISKDCKIRVTIKDKVDIPYFSISNTFGRSKEWFQRTYPNKCKYEK